MTKVVDLRPLVDVGPLLSPETKRRLKRCLREIRPVWPRLSLPKDQPRWPRRL